MKVSRKPRDTLFGVEENKDVYKFYGNKHGDTVCSIKMMRDIGSIKYIHMIYYEVVTLKKR